MSYRDGAIELAQHLKNAEKVAKIPWITSKETCRYEKKLEHTIYFKERMEFGDKERGKLNGLLYRVLNECFPPYLPIRFYSMNISALAKQETETGGNLILVSNHVKKILACGSRLYHDLSESIENRSGATTYRRLLSMLQGDRVKLKPDFEKCQNAQEFLLEPWVLVQLPFYPAVLHQWIVACLAEYLKFKEQLALINTLNVPRSFNMALQGLQSMDKVIHKTLTTLLIVLQLNPLSADNPMQYNSCLEFFGDDFSKTVQALEFSFSSKYLDIMKTLKRWSLNEDVEHRCGEGITCCSSCSKLKPDNMAFLYTYDFWTKPEGMSNIFGDSHAKCMKFKNKNKQVSQQHCSCNTVMSLPFVGSKLSFAYPNPNKAKTPNTASFMKFVDEKIISPGWLKGMEKEEILSKIKQDKKSLPKLLDAYSYYLWHAENSQGICAEDRGVIYEINMMTSQVVMSEILASMIKQLHSILTHDGSSKVYINAVGCEGPELTCLEIEESLPNMNKPCKKWTIEGILAQIEKQCQPPQSTECPGKDVRVEKAIELFEARVKHLAYKMYKNRLGVVEKGKKVQVAYLELPIVQYILPSMIASVHNLLAASGKPRDAKKLISFLHFLISEYENERGNLVKEGSIGGCVNFHSLLQTCCWDTFFTIFGDYTNKIFSISQKLFDPNLPFSIEVYKIIWGVYGDEKPYLHEQDGNWQTTFQGWNLDLFRFNSKVCRALELTAQKFNCPLERPVCDWLVFKANSHVSWVFTSTAFGSHLSTWRDTTMIISTLNECVELYNDSWKDPRLEKLADMKMVQATAVRFYMCQQNSDHRAKFKAAKRLMPITPKTSLEKAFCAYVNDDWWLLKQQMAAWATVEGSGDQSLVSLEFAKAKQDFYIPVLNTLGPDMKVKMKQRGEITFFPIKHCRWCGLVDCPEFRMCEMCQLETEYLDKNFFCSQRCENLAMEQVHGEHHERFVISKMKYL